MLTECRHREGILVYDIGSGGLPSYRDPVLNTEENGATVSIFAVCCDLASLKLLQSLSATGTLRNVLGTNYLASTSGSPDFAVPIGQVEYYSVVSRQTEQLPVSIQLVAHPGCDKMLIDFIEALADRGLVRKTKTGRSAY